MESLSCTFFAYISGVSKGTSEWIHGRGQILGVCGGFEPVKVGLAEGVQLISSLAEEGGGFFFSFPHGFLVYLVAG